MHCKNNPYIKNISELRMNKLRTLVSHVHRTVSIHDISSMWFIFLVHDLQPFGGAQVGDFPVLILLDKTKHFWLCLISTTFIFCV
jgi:hypothetical protein